MLKHIERLLELEKRREEEARGKAELPEDRQFVLLEEIDDKKVKSSFNRIKRRYHITPNNDLLNFSYRKKLITLEEAQWVSSIRGRYRLSEEDKQRRIEMNIRIENYMIRAGY